MLVLVLTSLGPLGNPALTDTGLVCYLASATQKTSPHKFTAQPLRRRMLEGYHIPPRLILDTRMNSVLLSLCY